MITVAPGHSIEQDESGRIVKSELSSERAREIGSGPHRKQRDQEAAALADAILATMREPDNQEFRDTARELLVRAASGIATKQGASSMAALTSLASAIREAFSFRPQTLPPYEPGRACPHCGQGGNLVMTADGLTYLRELVQRNAEMLLAEHA